MKWRSTAAAASLTTSCPIVSRNLPGCRAAEDSQANEMRIAKCFPASAASAPARYFGLCQLD